MAACCSINMRIFKTAEFILLLGTIVAASPIKPDENFFSRSSLSSTVDDSTNDEKLDIGDHYDQRQNGTENYRIHVDGLILVVAPIEGLLLAGGIPGVADSNIFGTSQQQTPEISNTEKPNKPDYTMDMTVKQEVKEEKKSQSGKSSQGTGLRLMNLLSPFLRRVHPHQ